MFVHPSQVAAIVAPPSGDRARRASSSTTADGSDRMTLHVEVAGQPVVERRGDRRVDPRHHQAARRSRVSRAGRAAERRQGDRRRAQVRLMRYDPAVSAATSTSALRERAGRSASRASRRSSTSARADAAGPSCTASPRIIAPSPIVNTGPSEPISDEVLAPIRRTASAIEPRRQHGARTPPSRATAA